MKNELKYRMYGLVPYNLSEIQKGIQFGHAVVEYGRNVNGIKPFENIYNKWADCDKTFIILNGGTTNNNPERLGTLNLHMQAFKNAGITFADFYEPDLGDQLTAFVFLVDERVWDREKYPDFIQEDSNIIDVFSQGYMNWVELIGGEKNLFLRSYLKTLKLA
jgi:hypothetical protein